MGNIRPSFIKIRALRLVEDYPDKFNGDFENNKLYVSMFTDLGNSEGKEVTNKKMRNWIAGYITRYKQRRVD
ncbi:MAG: 30S ribosomal protein S17e [Candidatus Poseidoniales archaeon]|jgi:small subunit ribosomal protein S17e|tara:strand:+ start:350 stop:565 length:216 start_codon:yes stop_codon:yes gene_type:complete